MSDARDEFSATEIIDLLSELDKRLKKRAVAASIFVVGGAAIAVTSHGNPRRTEDIDAITHDEAVLDEARAMAEQRKLPPNWLNTQAGPWMPPLPPEALQRPDVPGLHITYADDEFLLATKLIAQRRKDAPDIIALAGRLDMADASTADLAQLISRYYTDEEALEFILGSNDIEGEIALLAARAAKLLAAHPAAPTRPSPAAQPKATSTPRPGRDSSRGR